MSKNKYFTRKSLKLIQIIAAGLIGIFAVLVIARFNQKYYKSHSNIEIRSFLKHNQHTSINSALHNEATKIVSYPIIYEAARELNLINNNFTKEETARVLFELQKNISASILPNTNIIKLVTIHNNPEQAVAITNKIVEIYKNKAIKESNISLGKSKEYILNQIRQLETIINKDKYLFNVLRNKHGYISDSIILQKISIDLALELSRLLEIYNTAHPKIINIQKQINNIENKLSQSLEQTELDGKIKENEKRYNILNSKLNDIFYDNSLAEEYLKIISPAVEALYPIKSKTWTNYLIGGFSGLFIGFIFANSKRNNRNRRSPVPFASSINSTISPLNPSRNKNLLMFTGTVSKTVLTQAAIDYAYRSAESGLKTLLVEFDRRNPLIHRLLNISKEPGINEIIAGKIHWRESFHNVSRFDNLKIITAGGWGETKGNILLSDVMESFIEEVKSDFDIVLFNVSPLDSSDKILNLADKMNSIEFVCANKNDKVFKNIQNEFRNKDTDIHKIVINTDPAPATHIFDRPVRI